LLGLIGSCSVGDLQQVRAIVVGFAPLLLMLAVLELKSSSKLL
jgi:hypothetical protein